MTSVGRLHYKKLSLTSASAIPEVRGPDFHSLKKMFGFSLHIRKNCSQLPVFDFHAEHLPPEVVSGFHFQILVSSFTLRFTTAAVAAGVSNQIKAKKKKMNSSWR